MRYPERHAGETARHGREREALSRASARHEAHRVEFGASPFPEADAAIPVADVRAGRSSLTMSLATFSGIGYATACQLLGLRPSEPHKTRDGKDVRFRKRRRRPQTSPA